MKKLLSLFLILGIFFLGSCTYFIDNSDDNKIPDVDPGEDIGGEVEDNTSGDSDNKNGETSEDEKKEDDETPEDKNEETGPEEPSQIRETLSDYIEDLIDSDYCVDGDFLRFAANLDDRADTNIVYVSCDGDGDGSIDSPMSLEDALDTAKPGDTVYLRGGEYIFKEAIWLSISGTKDNYIVIKSYPGEKAVLTTTPENVNKYDENGEYLFFGLDSDCSYLIFEDLEIMGATDEYTAAFACYDGGQNHIIFRNNEIHDLNTTYTEGGCNAFLFLGEKKASINNIMLLNNRCYDMTLGYSEAISFAGNCEYCYVIGNEVYDNSNIGIDFYGNAGYCSTESLDQARYCVAAYNKVYNCNSPYADCAGIYVDGGRNCLVEGNLIYGCQYGIEIGSEEKNDKYPVTDITVRNNILQGNSVCAMRVGGYDTKSSGTVKNCFIYNNSLLNNLGEYDIIISKADGIVFANNVFFGSKEFVETEFSESYIKNLSFYSNCFKGSNNKLTIYGDELSLEDFNSRYGEGNFTYDISVGSDLGIDRDFSGCSDYYSKYDFYLCVRTKNQIGAVEFGMKEK